MQVSYGSRQSVLYVCRYHAEIVEAGVLLVVDSVFPPGSGVEKAGGDPASGGAEACDRPWREAAMLCLWLRYILALLSAVRQRSSHTWKAVGAEMGYLLSG